MAVYTIWKACQQEKLKKFESFGRRGVCGLASSEVPAILAAADGPELPGELSHTSFFAYLP